MAATFQDEGWALLWIPVGTTVTGILPAALKPADFAAVGVVDLAPFAIVGACEFVEAEPDTVDQNVYADKGKSIVPTRSNYTGKGSFRRDRDNTGTLTESDVLSAFTDRAEGYIIQRPGRPEATAWAATQDYWFGRYIASYTTPVNGPDGGYEQLDVGFLPRGDCGWGTVAAAA